MVLILIGVSGCGKSTIGAMLSEKLRIPFYDSDDFHPEKNIRKLIKGHPLTDVDRYPWLMILADKIAEWNTSGDAVLACSALKKSYRKILSDKGKTLFIYLKGERNLILHRMRSRENHFMPPLLLDDQIQTLEEPVHAITVSVDQRPEDILSLIIQELARLGITGK